MNPSRRELLTALMGAPLALHACKSAPPRPLEGKIIGAADGLGHRLLRGFRPRPADDAWQDVDIAIVGGGIAGLAAAWRLNLAGHQSNILLEIEPVMGGTSASGKNDITAYPLSAHYIPVPPASCRVVATLLREMGVANGIDDKGELIIGEEYLVREPEERIFRNGFWSKGLLPLVGATAEDHRQLKALELEIDRWVGWRDGQGRRAFAVPRAHGSDDPEVMALDRMSMHEFLERRGLNSEMLRWYVNYGCRDDYGTTLETTSAWAMVYYYAARKRQPGQESQPYISWPEGNGRFVDHMHSRVRERARTNAMVTEIAPAAENEPIEVWCFDTKTEKPFGYRAKQVIFCAPSLFARTVVRPMREEKPSYLNDFDYAPWMVANLTLKDRPRSQVGFPTAWDNVLYDSPALGYVVATHQDFRDYGPTVFTYYYALCDPDAKAARNLLLSTDWAGWTDYIFQDLKPAHPDLEEYVTRVDVNRMGHAMVRPLPGFVCGQSRLKAMKPYRGIHLAHSDLSGIALLEEASDQGVRAAEAALKAVGQPVESIRW